MAEDHYQTLGVPRTASAEDIRKAYRELARTGYVNAQIPVWIKRPGRPPWEPPDKPDHPAEAEPDVEAGSDPDHPGGLLKPVEPGRIRGGSPGATLVVPPLDPTAQPGDRPGLPPTRPDLPG